MGHNLNQWAIRQLYNDYDLILYQYKLNLKVPLIQVCDQEKFWALWDPELRVIQVNRRLLVEYPWQTVLDVFKHEIAHQIVDELYVGDNRERPHGSLFQQACEHIGVPLWARKSSGPLDKDSVLSWQDPRLDPASDQEARMLRKIEKLLALGTSSNEHEAALAMERVQEIYRRYNLERIQNLRESDMVSLEITRRLKRTSSVETRIFSILVEYFFVRVVHTESYDYHSGEPYNMAEVMGTRENVLTAEYVYHFLWQKIHLMWKEHAKSKGLTARYKNSYLLGLLGGFSQKLDQQRKSFDQSIATQEGIKGGSRALVLRDHRLIQYVEQRFPRLCKRSASTTRVYSESYASGTSDGKKINLHKAVHHKSDGQRHLLA